MNNELIMLTKEYLNTIYGLPTVFIDDDSIESWKQKMFDHLPAFIINHLDKEFSVTFNEMETETIYIIKDVFELNFVLIKLEEISKFLVIGPFLTREYSENEILNLLEKKEYQNLDFNLIRGFYISQQKVSLNTVIEMMKICLKKYNNSNSINVVEIDKEFKENPFDNQKNDEHNKQIIDRYDLENAFLMEVKNGDLQAAKKLHERLRTETTNLNIISDSLTHQKNLSIIFNTLLRKTTQDKIKHILNLDYVFWDFMYKIQNEHNVLELYRLRERMVVDYIELIKENNNQHYSLIIRDALDYINNNLNRKLTLKKMADSLHISPNYLSKKFNEEIKVSLSDYINDKRLEKMALLLKTTSYQITEIIYYVGFSDLSYASRLFKEKFDKSPKEYRNNQS
ncbi:AraC family transcriptional regulator [Erysipelotrichaceae bacterium OttesenSCG-928-M19]|nr:AraC family transcriptional regulator [Erysipelotrichaceae bacterium OttesenSCG-928-M19]